MKFIVLVDIEKVVWLWVEMSWLGNLFDVFDCYEDMV